MKRILVADDDPTTLTLVEKLLSQEEYEVTAVADGGAAMELLKTQAFDLILLDIMMPGVDGFEVSRTFKAELGNRKTPVIFITSRQDPGALKQGFQAGGIMILPKPFSALQLTRIVRSMIRG